MKSRGDNEASVPRRRGRTAFDVLLGAVLAGIVVAILAPGVGEAGVRADVRAVSREAKALYDAFERYRVTHGEFPTAWGSDAFDPGTLEPLARRGYYTGRVRGLLAGSRADAYDSPDDRGPNREFWIEMTLASDTRVRFVIARSDDAPMGGGAWLDGAYVFRSGRLERL
jgi:hypothetical protein